MRNWDESHDLDADLMRELLLGRLAVVPDPRGLRVRGVRIRRRVDLDLVHSPVLLAVHDSLLDEGASANDIANLGQLLKTMAPYAPPPRGRDAAAAVGRRQHVRELLGDRVTDLEFRRQTVVMDHCASPLAFREYWKRNDGPTIAVYRSNAADPERPAALDADFLAFLTAWNRAEVPGRTAYPADYLLVTARRTSRSNALRSPHRVGCGDRGHGQRTADHADRR